MTPRDTSCAFVPPYLLAHIASTDAPGAERSRDTLVLDQEFRARREARTPTGPAAPPTAAWTVHSADNTTRLPGRPVRAAGQSESGDVAVDEAAEGIAATLRMFADGLGLASYDDAGAPVSLTVHYGQDYDNAFWDGVQLVFGDGDGKVFERFTKPVDVLTHEFAHAVTEHTAGLVYRGQSGALNESVSDVFAACLKQHLRGETAEEGDWLIGEGLFLPTVRARALRDMAAPGTAYDDPVLGKDPQVGHLDDYVETTEDNGGVHLNSGIPNKAFQLAAVAIGGTTLEGAAPIWLAALRSGDVRPTTDFAGFAAATVAVAGEHADAVRQAWAEVGVGLEVGAEPGRPGPGAPVGGSVVRVTRSGGFAGRTASGEVDLEADDPRASDVRHLVDRLDLASARGGPPMPDMFVYRFEVCGAPPVEVPEQQLTDDLAALARIVLARPDDLA
ncbi:peptidase M4 [Nocardioides gansuensis]|uniref:Neutral metalloproteinase n=1 Tax=Nocardioides gansuensis TaxID=2138300 RepID=A0A2T8FFT1_9ACTN|nr:protealysin inhibitor emfourin [Nocardioides gansuensis]PVG84559.1 peptidase M4 [Nocardioides gansuensis]